LGLERWIPWPKLEVLRRVSNNKVPLNKCRKNGSAVLVRVSASESSLVRDGNFNKKDIRPVTADTFSNAVLIGGKTNLLPNVFTDNPLPPRLMTVVITSSNSARVRKTKGLANCSGLSLSRRTNFPAGAENQRAL